MDSSSSELSMRRPLPRIASHRMIPISKLLPPRSEVLAGCGGGVGYVQLWITLPTLWYSIYESLYACSPLFWSLLLFSSRFFCLERQKEVEKSSFGPLDRLHSCQCVLDAAVLSCVVDEGQWTEGGAADALYSSAGPGSSNRRTTITKAGLTRDQIAPPPPIPPPHLPNAIVAW